MPESVQVGSIVDGKVVKIKPFGAIVSLGDGAQGLVHISQISEKYVQDINDIVGVGDVVTVKVLAVDEENHKITLSMKEAVAGGRGGNASAQSDRGYQRRSFEDREQAQKPGEMSFDDKLKDWIKQSNERQAGINKRNNRR